MYQARKMNVPSQVTVDILDQKVGAAKGDIFIS
jgi:hypothetical protein